MLMSTTSARLTTPTGPGSVFGAPNLPAGFSDTFTSRYVDTGALRMHAVIGGEGPPLLLVHGWPQTGYAWPRVMATLARDVQVIAVDQRGIGLTDNPQGGYDTGTQARDLVALLQALGHRRTTVYGTDTAMPIAYALAAAPTTPSGWNAWSSPRPPSRANEQRKARRLRLPVLAIGGVERAGAMVADAMQLVADDVQGVVLADAGHWVAEQAPEQLLAALTTFLAPYRVGALT
jgi:pimeloyl-ACP methyl ester carboxylesterase